MENSITVCIATYRYDVEPLLQDLLKATENIAGQNSITILIGDDASGEPFQTNIDALTQGKERLRVIRPPQNLGRVGIRNLLAKEAQTEWILFIDADSRLPRSDYLALYLKEANTEVDVIAGGTAYLPFHNPPLLRELYGQAREVVSASNRAKNPYKRLALNNLLIRKETFWKVGGLDTTITGYGHEDTLLGKQLEAIRATIRHIDNPVLHVGLENDAVFIQKSEEAAIGLARLYHQGKLTAEDAKMIRIGRLVTKYPISWILGLVAGLLPQKSLTALDLRKLVAFCKELSQLDRSEIG